MAQLGREPDLAQKALGAERLRQIGLEHLDRDLAIVFEVAREVHGRHAARAELALDAIAVGEGGLKRRGGVHVVATRRAT